MKMCCEIFSSLKAKLIFFWIIQQFILYRHHRSLRVGTGDFPQLGKGFAKVSEDHSTTASTHNGLNLGSSGNLYQIRVLAQSFPGKVLDYWTSTSGTSAILLFGQCLGANIRSLLVAEWPREKACSDVGFDLWHAPVPVHQRRDGVPAPPGQRRLSPMLCLHPTPLQHHRRDHWSADQQILHQVWGWWWRQ